MMVETFLKILSQVLKGVKDFAFIEMEELADIVGEEKSLC